MHTYDTYLPYRDVLDNQRTMLTKVCSGICLSLEMMVSFMTSKSTSYACAHNLLITGHHFQHLNLSLILFLLIFSVIKSLWRLPRAYIKPHVRNFHRHNSASISAPVVLRARGGGTTPARVHVKKSKRNLVCDWSLFYWPRPVTVARAILTPNWILVLFVFQSKINKKKKKTN
ncbi:hypothetical protein OJAV_G00000640 [Oryzias javanicus]|uniref:Transmembrane protein n=1 Tax=Oryzias javanicus TaxID=123683 RepID=A0A3S2N850_ORYJA|nr:hypothetical protein OJAV_G00000640 [Oryzias javanicus]